jgi:mRNA-degrading endonuclease RelE of RelBE toxin-antitoxin system
VPFEIKIALQVGKHMKSLPKEEARVIKSHIDELKKDLTHRSQCNILKESGSDHRFID